MNWSAKVSALAIILQLASAIVHGQQSKSLFSGKPIFDSLQFVPHQRLEGSALLKSKKIVVCISLSEVCMISQFYIREFHRIAREWSTDSIGFLGFFPNPFSDSQAIKEFHQTYQLTIPLAMDRHAAFSRFLGVAKTPEVVILKNGRIVYKGPIDDYYVAIGRHRGKTNFHYLENALKALSRGKNPESPWPAAVGCLIDFRLWHLKRP